MLDDSLELRIVESAPGSAMKIMPLSVEEMFVESVAAKLLCPKEDTSVEDICVLSVLVN